MNRCTKSKVRKSPTVLPSTPSKTKMADRLTRRCTPIFSTHPLRPGLTKLLLPLSMRLLFVPFFLLKVHPNITVKRDCRKSASAPYLYVGHPMNAVKFYAPSSTLALQKSICYSISKILWSNSSNIAKFRASSYYCCFLYISRLKFSIHRPKASILLLLSYFNSVNTHCNYPLLKVSVQPYA